MKTLEQTYKFRADSEPEAVAAIDNYKKHGQEGGYTLKKASYEYKTKKAKGEIIDDGYLVSVTMSYASFWDEE